MGSYLSSCHDRPAAVSPARDVRDRLVAVIGLVTACTASSVGAAKRAPDRYPAGAIRSRRQAQTDDTTSADTPQSLRLEKQQACRRVTERRTIRIDPAAHRARYELTPPGEHQSTASRNARRGPRLPRPVGCSRPDDRRRPSSEPGELAGSVGVGAVQPR